MNNKPKKPGRRRRRVIWTLSILIIVGFVARATLPLALPMVLRKVAGNFGMTCGYDRLELNLFSGDAGIWGLEFKPTEGGEPILAADYCHGNVSVLNLFKGKLNVWRVEADGVDVNLDRNIDGHIPLLERFIAATAKNAATPAAPAATTAKPVTMDLSSPLRVDALRLDHIRVHIHDRGVSPEVDTELAMDIRLSDLGSTTHPAKFEMNLSADPLLDTMRINGEGRSAGKTLDAKLNVLVRGIRLKPAAAYLAPLGIRPVSDGITLTATGEVHTAPAPNNAEGFTASIAFDHLSAMADRQESLALDHFKIDSGVIDTKSIRIERFILDGARAVAGRASDGNLQIAGIEYDPTMVAAKPPAPKTPTPTPPLLLTLMRERWSVGELALKNGRVDFHDQGIAPAVDLSLVADELSASSIDHDPANLNTSVTLTGRLHAPGMVRDINIDGTATPFADDKKFAVKLNATGIKPDAISPYLDQIGVESTLQNGQFTAAANASLKLGDTLAANASLKFDFRDDVPLLSPTTATISGVTLDPKTGAIGIGDIELSGPAISVLRTSDEQLAALGFRTKPAVAVAAAPNPPPSKDAASTPATQPFAMASLPRMMLGKFGWNGLRIDLEDRTTTPPTKLSIPEIGITASDLTTDVNAKTPGQFKLWLASPQVARQVQAVGSLTALPAGVKVFAKLDGAGLNTTPFAPYLKSLGVEPMLKDGAVTGMGTATVQLDATGPSASLSLQEFKYTDGSTTLASVDHVLIDNATLGGRGIAVDKILVASPHARARRDADGSFAAGGFRLVLPIATEESAVLNAPKAAPVETKPSAAFGLMVKKIEVIDASIDWADLAVQPNVNLTASTSLNIDHVFFGPDSQDGLANLQIATMQMNANIVGVAEGIDVTGKVVTNGTQHHAELIVHANGLQAGPLTSYFPPGIGCSLHNGAFATNVDVNVSLNSAGGIAADLTIGPVNLNDGANLLHVDSVRAAASRIDLPGNVLAFDELSINGVDTFAEKRPNGDLACMGLLITPQPQAAKPVSETHQRAGSGRVMTPTTGPSVAELVAASHQIFPLVTVDKLNVNVGRFAFTDLSRPASSPLTITVFELRNVDRVELLGSDAQGKPPTKLELIFRASPLVDRVQVDVSATPFARQPRLNVIFNAIGVHGEGLTELVPELKDQLDGTAMSDGSLTAHFEAEAKLDRRNPVDFDVSHGFDLNFVLNKVAYRSKPDGPVLAGVDEVRSEGIRIVPNESIVHFKTLEITKPIGLITQDAAGIHALGWTYKIPNAQSGAVASTPQAGTEVPRRAGSAAETAAEIEKPTGEIRIDKLLISGLDFYVEDSAVTPPLVIPLNGLDVEVRNLSSLAPYEDKPIRFSAIVNAGKVNLPKKGSNPPVMEQRDLFSQITANGEVSLYPQLHGWTKTSVSSLDLAALQGAAAQFNETLTAGLYDSTVDLRFDPTGAVVVNSRFTLTDLSLSEPPGGLIYTTLHLPAPLDMAIGAVQGADGSIALPVNLSIDPKDISYAAVTEAAAKVVLSVITTAIAAAPEKAINNVGALIGLGGSKAPKDLTTTIAFAPGSAAFGPEQSAAISKLLQELHDDHSLTVTLRQQLGSGDVELSRVRANPTTEQSASLEAQLRLHKSQLLQLRADAAGRARADLVSLGESSASGALEHLRAIDREIAAADESLDQVGELLKPGADRLANRRTKTAALQIAADRLSEVRTAMLASGVEHDRVKVLSAQFNPSDEMQGGKVVILVLKK